MTTKRALFWGGIGLLLAVWSGLVLWPEKAPSRPASSEPSEASEPGRKPPRTQSAPPVPEGTPAAAGPASPDVPANEPGPDEAPAQPGKPEPGIAARVNGEPIYGADVAAGIDRERYGLMMQDARRTRLDRLISLVGTRQYLRAAKVEVPAAEVAAQVEELKRNPPAAGCSCCRYGSLQEFLSANLMTMKDLEVAIGNNIGMERHGDALWNEAYPPGGKRDDLLARERARIGREYVVFSHVFFNTVQQPDFQADPDTVRAEAGRKAATAWKRLQKGEDFAGVAREVSEDAFSKPKGGSLGCMPADAFGASVEEVLRKLKPGEVARPVESPWGWHVLRRDAMSDQDVLEALQTEFRNKRLQEVCESIEKSAKVERFDGVGQ